MYSTIYFFVGQRIDFEEIFLIILHLYICSGIELWSTFPEFTNPDKLAHSSPEYSFAKALSAPVATCAPVKPRATCQCSNTFVIDARQAPLSMPGAPTTPSLPQARVKVADRVYFGGSPSGGSSVELIDHSNI